MTKMKLYQLSLYGKQGDDFTLHMGDNGSPAFGLKRWADCFANSRDVCLQIAKHIEGQNIRVSADTHMILFSPDDAKAEKVLDMLVAEDYLSVFPDDNE